MTRRIINTIKNSWIYCENQNFVAQY